MKFEFENMRVYWQALTFAKNIHFVSADFPEKHLSLKDKIRQVSLSIVQIIARSSVPASPERRSILLFEAYYSCMDLIPLLEMAREARLISIPDYHRFRGTVEDLCAALKDAPLPPNVFD
ncbi:MAG: four helix bundle protein [Candidatus Omnitrophota bacterium]